MVWLKAIQYGYQQVLVSKHHRLFHTKPIFIMAIFTADFGGNSWTVYDASIDRIIPLPIEDFFTLDFLNPGSTLIVEQAHLGSPRNETSLAQVYTAEELLDLYARAEEKQCIIRLFPQSCSAKARAKWGDGDKTDEVDVKAIYNMVINSPFMPLMKPPKSFVASHAREAGWSFKAETNGILNKARRFKYEDDGDEVVRFIDANLKAFANRLSDNAKRVFDLDKVKKDGSFYASSKRRSRLYTLAALFVHPEGYARIRPDTGELPGIRWLRNYVLHMSPFHFRGGIARSNLYWHGFRNYAIKEMGTRKASSSGKVLSHYDFTPQQDAEFRRHRRDFTNGIIEGMQVMRDLAKNQYSCT